MNKQLLSIADFCKEANISRALFYNLKQRGKAPLCIKVGKRTLISKQAFENWIAELEAIATNDNAYNRQVLK